MLRLKQEILHDVMADIGGLFRAVVEKVPVDTGAAAASFNFNNDDFDPSKLSSEKSVTEVLNARISDPYIQFSSKCPYLDSLESGYSKQAPLGFFNLSILSYEAKINGRLLNL